MTVPQHEFPSSVTTSDKTHLSVVPSKLEVVDESKPVQRYLNAGRQTIRISQQHLKLNDDTEYDARVYEPANPSEVKVSYTTPWCTDLDGLNDLVGRSLAQRNVLAVAIGPPKAPLHALPHMLNRISLEHDAHVQHTILDWYEASYDSQTKQKELLTVGFSRAAIIALGVHALSPHYDRKVHYGNFTDLVLEHPVERKDIAIHELVKYLGKEVMELASGISHYRPTEIPHMAKTVSLSPSFWINQLAVTKSIFAGTAGDFVVHLARDTVADVSLYDDSMFNQADDWQAALEPFPYITTHRKPGLHMTGTDPIVRKSTVDDISTIEALLRENVKPADIHKALKRR